MVNVLSVGGVGVIVGAGAVVAAGGVGVVVGGGAVVAAGGVGVVVGAPSFVTTPQPDNMSAVAARTVYRISVSVLPR
jgi:hypothetical protein